MHPTCHDVTVTYMCVLYCHLTVYMYVCGTCNYMALHICSYMHSKFPESVLHTQVSTCGRHGFVTTCNINFHIVNYVITSSAIYSSLTNIPKMIINLPTMQDWLPQDEMLSNC